MRKESSKRWWKFWGRVSDGERERAKDREPRFTWILCLSSSKSMRLDIAINIASQARQTAISSLLEEQKELLAG